MMILMVGGIGKQRGRWGGQWRRERVGLLMNLDNLTSDRVDSILIHGYQGFARVAEIGFD